MLLRKIGIEVLGTLC